LDIFVALVAYDVLLELSSTELYDLGLKVLLLFSSPLVAYDVLAS